MFKDFERIANEQKSEPAAAGESGTQQDPFAQLFAGLGGEGGAEGENPFNDA